MAPCVLSGRKRSCNTSSRESSFCHQWKESDRNAFWGSSWGEVQVGISQAFFPHSQSLPVTMRCVVFNHSVGHPAGVSACWQRPCLGRCVSPSPPHGGDCLGCHGFYLPTCQKSPLNSCRLPFLGPCSLFQQGAWSPAQVSCTEVPVSLSA